MAHLLLYDGVCGLCNRSVQFVLRRDRRDRFEFAALQGHLAADVLGRYGHDPRDLDTIYVVADYEGATERLLSRGRAVLFVATELGGPWNVGHLFRPLPTPVLDAMYGVVMRSRYRWFGKLDACLVPNPAQKRKFIDAG